MNVTSSAPQLPRRIRSKLAALRWRIRLYVILEGLALAVVWLGLTFWAGLALDYGLILLGSSELPWGARLVLLAIIALVLGIILYRFVLRRLAIRLADHSMAVLLERRYPQFGDSLLTAVEMTEHPDHAHDFNAEMLADSTEKAEHRLAEARLRPVFNYSPLARSLAAAGLALATVAIFFLLNKQAFGVWVSRLYGLQDRPWPRQALIEVAGVEVTPPATRFDAPPRPGAVAGSRLRRFDKGRVKVAKGSDVLLRVEADADRPVVPEYCRVYYATADGDRGMELMNKIGEPRSGRQLYTYDRRPLKAILSSLRFDVLGHDFRLNGFRLDVVEAPVVIETKLDCVFPDYMVNESLGLWLPRTLDLAAGVKLPEGSKVRVRVQTNKRLQAAYVYATDSAEPLPVKLVSKPAPGFEFDLAPLTKDVRLFVSLHDQDDVLIEAAHRINLGVIPDEPPQVEIALRGISTAITPDARVPIRGRIRDPYGVEKAWFDVELPHPDSSQPPQTRERPFALGSQDAAEAALDFRAWRMEKESPVELKPEQRIVLSIKAQDRYNLNDQPAHVGSSDLFELEVVTPDQLLARLEVRELSHRRRFEQMIEEATEMRDSLIRLRSELSGESKEPTDPEDEQLDPEKAAERARSLRRLRSQRAIGQSQKSGQEVLGLAAAFVELREELENNRLDTEDRKIRLQEQIAAPLEQIGKVQFAELDKRLARLNEQLEDAAQGPKAADVSVEQANLVLAEMDKVLQKMIELESFNELVDMVRDLLKGQSDLMEETKKQQKRSLFE